MPYVFEQYEYTSDFYIAFRVTYDEMKGLMSERKQLEYKDINENNWYEYTIIRKGSRLPLYYYQRGDGPYHEETRFAICVGEDGYTISYEEISPMGGGYSSGDVLPFGFFKDKSLPEIEKLLRDCAKYIAPQNVRLGSGDYSLLIRTDEYYSK